MELTLARWKDNRRSDPVPGASCPDSIDADQIPGICCNCAQSIACDRIPPAKW